MPLSKPLLNFLNQSLVARIAVVDPQGYPHVVPIWYVRDGEEIVFFSSRNAKKIGYIDANSKGAVTLGGEPYGAEGYLLKGKFTLEEDENHRWLSEIVHRYEPKKLADQHVEEWGAGDLVLMRF